MVLMGTRVPCGSLMASLVKALGGQHDLVFAIEDTSSLSAFVTHFKRRLRRYGVFRTADMVVLYFVLIVKSIFVRSPAPVAGAIVETTTWASLNDDAFLAFLKGKNVDVMLAIGTGLLDARIFEVPRRAALNLHPGICPGYRGAGGNFWALHQRDFSNIGVTLHHLETRIDAGAMVSMQRFLPRSDDSLETLMVRAYDVGVGLFCEAIEHNALDAEHKAPTAVGEGRLYGFYGLTHYIRAWYNLWRFRHSL